MPRVILPDGDGYPLLHLMLEANAPGRAAFKVSDELKQADPGVNVIERMLTDSELLVHPLNLIKRRTAAPPGGCVKG